VKHDWQRRAELYDVWRDKRYLERRETERERLLDELSEVGGALIGAGVTRLTGPPASRVKGGRGARPERRLTGRRRQARA
jgi:hypothetical protein